MSDSCATQREETCKWERGRGDIYQRLDDIRNEQHAMHLAMTQQLASLTQQMINVLPHDLPRMRARVAVMWGVMTVVGGTVALIIVGALLSSIVGAGR